MNVLIVDDEPYSVQGINRSLPWKKLGVDETFEAYSLQQAQAVFQSHPVDLMICDIEMPKGSGIQLVDWAQKSGYHPICIFLTCYSKFEYASQAIRLQVFDYILKPVEYSVLEEVVQRALAELKRRRDLETHKLQSGYWVEDQGRRVSDFWRSLVTGSLQPQKKNLQAALKREHLDSEMLERRYYLAFLQIHPSEKASGWDQSQLQYAVANITHELLPGTVLVRLEAKKLLAVTDSVLVKDPPEYQALCSKLASALDAVLPAKFSIYYSSQACTMWEAETVYRMLVQDSKNNLSAKTMTFQHGGRTVGAKPVSIQAGTWSEALLSHNSSQVLADIKKALYPQGKAGAVDRAVPVYLFHALLDATYQSLHQDPASVYQQLTQGNEELFDSALDSVSDFYAWASRVLDQVQELVPEPASSSQAMVVVQKYIREHLDEDLNRKTLSKVAHLNPDYLSTLFRKHTGETLSHYILKERIQQAKKDLVGTNLPIHEIALRTGFPNISYFSKQFKDLEGMTPLQFRKEKRKL